MLILLSPAKSLDETSTPPRLAVSQPRLLAESEQLVEVMRGRSLLELSRLSRISEELAALNATRWAEWTLPFTRTNARPAIWMFTGDVYQGMDVRGRFGVRDHTWANRTVRILSGLYGVLRPLDLIQPYRLEMGTALATSRGSSLYEWWGARITELLAADLATSPGARVVVNLASLEYARSVDLGALEAPVISPRFETVDANGRRRMIAFHAKRARGELAAWLVLQRARSARAVTRFDQAGYRYDAASSTPQVPVFVREA